MTASLRKYILINAQAQFTASFGSTYKLLLEDNCWVFNVVNKAMDWVILNGPFSFYFCITWYRNAINLYNLIDDLRKKILKPLLFLHSRCNVWCWYNILNTPFWPFNTKPTIKRNIYYLLFITQDFTEQIYTKLFWCLINPHTPHVVLNI